MSDNPYTQREEKAQRAANEYATRYGCKAIVLTHPCPGCSECKKCVPCRTDFTVVRVTPNGYINTGLGIF